MAGMEMPTSRRMEDRGILSLQRIEKREGVESSAGQRWAEHTVQGEPGLQTVPSSLNHASQPNHLVVVN